MVSFLGTYLHVERLMLLAEDGGEEEKAEAARTIMDTVWLQLTPTERQQLNERPEPGVAP